jgi:hypothetical protein
MAQLQYIGARYVPKYYENSLDPSSSEWESDKVYEALTVVTWNDVSYTSKIPVPANIGAPDLFPAYWVKNADMPAAIHALQEEVNDLSDKVDDMDNFISDGRSATFKTIMKTPQSAYMQTITGGTSYKNLQGVAYDSIRNHYAFFIIIQDASDVLMVILDDDMTTVINSQEFANADLGHGNDFCYNPKIDRYVCTPANGDGNKILTINPTTLTIENTYTPTPPASITDERLAGITYDEDNDVYYVLTGLGFWIIKGDFTTDHFVSADTLSALKFLPYDVARWTNFYNNGITCKDHKIYVICQYSNNPRQSWMIVYNIDGNVFTTYQLPNADPNSEYESAELVDDVIMLFSTYNYFNVYGMLLQNQNSDEFYSPYYSAKRIAANTDLNDINVYGKYFCSSGNVDTIVNAPSKLTAFTLTVDSQPTTLTQTIEYVINHLVTRYSRQFTLSNSSWSTWERLTKNIIPLTTESLSTVCPGYANYQGVKIIFTIPHIHLNNISTHPISDITATYTVRVYSDHGVYVDSGNQDITEQNSTLELSNDITGIKFILTLPTADSNIANHAITVNILSMTLTWS